MSTYAGIPKDEGAAMTFEEIGRALGITTQGARQTFARGIAKLVRSESDALVRLLKLSEMRQELAAKRIRVHPSSGEETLNPKESE